MGRLQGTQPELYEDFLAKFAREKTTDDCFTPDNVYEAALIALGIITLLVLRPQIADVVEHILSRN